MAIAAKPQLTKYENLLLPMLAPSIQNVRSISKQILQRLGSGLQL